MDAAGVTPAEYLFHVVAETHRMNYYYFHHMEGISTGTNVIHKMPFSHENFCAVPLMVWFGNITRLLLTPRLDYCNALHVKLPMRSVQKFQFIWIAVARMLTVVGCRNHISPIMAHLLLPNLFLDRSQGVGLDFQSPIGFETNIPEGLPTPL